MENSIGFRVKNAWNAFMGRSPTQYYGATNYYRQDKFQLSTTTKQTIVASIFNRIALDVASAKIRHCMLDDNHRFTGEVDDGLNNCLSLEANIDQTANVFIQDVVISMFDEGCVAILPIDTIRPDTAIWLFLEMIKSLGLTGMDEDHYNFRYVEECIDNSNWSVL